MSKFLKYSGICAAILCVALTVSVIVKGGSKPSDGQYSFQVYTTNDIHGRYFDSLYVGTGTRPSLLSVSALVNDARTKYGEGNVILLDAGDGVQGDNAAYYFNYVDTLSEHIFFRMVEYMKYDALAVGNHDIETGHSNYDRFRESCAIPYLAGNAIKTGKRGKPYFDSYTVLTRNKVKILVLGFTNSNIKNWLSPKLWEGMTFENLIPFVQNQVDALKAKTKAHAVIVLAHTGTGHGNGDELENQGLDLLNSLTGVDLVVCSHDHIPYTATKDGCSLMNSGSHCRNVAHGTIELDIREGKVVSSSTSAEIIPVEKSKVDEVMKAEFADDFDKVRQFTLTKVGELAMPLVTRDAYTGMCDYLNLLHTVCLGCAPAQISIAAPLTFNGYVKAGEVLFNDLFTIYPFENQLFVIKMTGDQIRRYLEYSYDGWINTYSKNGHLLKIEQRKDQRTDTDRWSFIGAMFNFDSAAGVNYTVDVTAEYGSRVNITTLADGTPFSPDEEYNVAMTSYRASGGGGLLKNGAGTDTENIDDYVVEKYPEIRDLIKDFIAVHPVVTPEIAGDAAILGQWRFVPEDLAGEALAKDMDLVFPKR